MPLLALAGLIFGLLTAIYPVLAKENESPIQGVPLIEILDNPSLTEEDRNEIFRRGSDDRRTFLKELFPIWNQPSGSGNNLLRARAGWLIGRFWDDDAKDDPKWDYQAVMKGAIALIESERLPVPIHELRFFELDYQVIRKQSNLMEIEEQILSVAHQIEDPNEKAYALSQLIVYFSQRGIETKDLPKLLNEVHQLLGFRYENFSIVDVDTLNNLSIALQGIGQTNEAKVIEAILDDVCDKEKMRNFCAARTYNAGFYLTYEDSPDSIVLAITKFHRSLELSKEVQDEKRIGTVYLGLNRAYNKTKDFKQAIQFGHRAVEVFTTLKNPLWAALSWKTLSASYQDDHNLDLALEAGQKALQICPEEFKSIQSGIHKQLSQVYAARGEFGEAFRSLSAYVTSEKIESAEDANKKYMELRNQALHQQNELQAEQITLLKKFRIVSMLAAALSLAICAVLLIVWRQASAIRISRQKMKDVLDHIDEGIFVLDRHLRIQSGYSPYLDKILGRESGALLNYPLLDLLFPTDAAGDNRGVLVREALASCLGEKHLSWELNSSHLPNEWQYQDMILALHWQPLLNAQEFISSFLVSIRDITELRTIEKKMELESQRVSLLQRKLEEILGGKSAMIRNLFRDLKSEWAVLHEQIFHPDQRAAAMRRLHTWKGAARTLGLKQLAACVHDMESCLTSTAPFSLATIGEKWNALNLSFQDYEHLLNTILVSQRSEEFTATDLYAYANLYANEIKSRLDQVNCQQQGIMVLDHVPRWKPKVLPLIHDMLLHAVSNALDHGFIRPIQEGRQLAPALIQIQAVPVQQHIELRVLDNGAGINWDGLRKKADAIGFRPGPDESYADLLFQDGVSTASSTTETSGRGVGLSAIRSICLQLGGQVFIENAAGGGTALRMEFPFPSVCEEPILRAG